MDYIYNSNTTDKVVFLGDFGVGKTVALESLSDIPVINTDVLSREAIQQDFDAQKTTTTVGFDYGEWTLDASRKVHLFGMPSQDRFHAIREIIIPGSSAIVVWAYGNKPEGVEQCQRWLELLQGFDIGHNVCIAVTRIEHNNETVLNRYREMVETYLPLTPVISADPRSKDSVIQAVLVALSSPDLVS